MDENCSIDQVSVARARRAGIPSDRNTIVVEVWMLQDGEEKIIAERIREVLSQAITS